ncbi:PREDICTED: annexin A6 [Aptenodytes forsteri]|uniref:annexin A6 n=1 Tax=Aptenodytes forsteri TaxID=9233 RepID=UPI0004F4390C|nr:PREDICTED: annexin A6 [Aptenodytes forsteri]
MAPKGKVYRGSVKDFPGFDASQDAEALYNAMKGFGSDKDAILDLITSRSNKQRVEICQAYKSLYGKDLIADLKYELTGKFERLIVSLMRPPAYSDAKEIKDAIAGIGTDEKCLIEILASRTNQEIHNLVAAYKDAYERDLETDIIGDTSGHFKKMLIVLLQGTREEDDVVSEDLVEQDAKDLLEAGELKWGTDEAQFIYILGRRSKQHLRLVFDEYLKISGKPIERSIRGELSGDFEKLMLAVVKCIRSTAEYFAERLYKAMKGLGTRDNTLIRIMVSRSEIDMLDIREVFRTKYEKSLYNTIKEDTSGEYKKALLKLCGGDDDAAGEFFPGAGGLSDRMNPNPSVHPQLRGTVQPTGGFNNDGDAQVLRKAMKGLGTDEGAIIEVVTQRSNAQRQQILKAYKAHYGRDLMADLKSELSGSLAKLILGLMLTPAQYDAKQLRKAVEGAGTDESILIEIMATRNNQEIAAINEAYQEAYHTRLEDDLSSDTSGHLKRILVSLALGNRDEGPENLTQAHEDAKVVAETLKLADVSSNDSSDSLETRFLSILCTRSYPHLRRVFQEFIKMTNHDVEHAIRKRMSGDVRDAFLAIVRSVKNKPAFFADKLYKSMKGAGTDERTLTRIMISRSEIDLLNIRGEFIDLFDKSLHYMIEKDTSGDYRKALLALCGGED